jgi:hypothetical protein
VGKRQSKQVFILIHLFSVITYTVLCGYQPFQGEDNVELMDDITHARYEFHERYWGNVSADGMLLFCFESILNVTCLL